MSNLDRHPLHGYARRPVVTTGWHATIAVLVLSGLIVQIWVAVSVSATPPAHSVGTLAGTSLAGRVVRVLSFFTIQSNILSGVVSAQLARHPNREVGYGGQSDWPRW